MAHTASNQSPSACPACGSPGKSPSAMEAAQLEGVTGDKRLEVFRGMSMEARSRLFESDRATYDALRDAEQVAAGKQYGAQA